MKLTILICALIVGYTYGQGLFWHIKHDGLRAEDNNVLTLDSEDNVLMVANYQYYIENDATLILDTLQSGYGMTIVKRDRNGNLIWTKEFTSLQPVHGYEIVTDAQNNIIVGGLYKTTIDFDPGTGVAEHNAMGTCDGFVLKLDSEGNYMWVKTFNSPYVEVVYSVCVDNESNVLVGVDTDATTQAVKLSPLGAEIWSKTYFGGYPLIHKIRTDQNNNVFVLCEYLNGIYPDPNNPVDYLNNSGVLLTKFLPNGQTSFSYPLSTCYTIDDMEVSAENNVFLSYIFSGTINLGGIPYASTAPKSNALVKLDNFGNIQGVRILSSTQSYYRLNIAIKDDLTVYVGGSFRDDFSIDNTPLLTSENGSANGYVLELDSNMNLINSPKHYASMNDNYMRDITVGRYLRIHQLDFNSSLELDSTTVFNTTNSNVPLSLCYFDCNPDLYEIASDGDNLLYVVNPSGFDDNYQWIDCATNLPIPGATSDSLIVSQSGSYRVFISNGAGCQDSSACFTIQNAGQEVLDPLTISVYPNPTNDLLTIEVSKDLRQIQLISLSGEKVLEVDLLDKTKSISTAGVAPGLYLLKVVFENGDVGQQRIIKY